MVVFVPMNVVVTILLVAVVLIGVLIFYTISQYNSMVTMRNRIQESWRQIDVELNRRYELIPNLVKVVRSYADHEQNVLERVINLRNQAASLASGGADQDTRAQIEGQLGDAVRSLMVSVEAYPELRSNANYLELQRELVQTEDRIAAGRRYYNANVRSYNTKVQSFPANVLASRFNFTEATYFELSSDQARQMPEIDLG